MVLKLRLDYNHQIRRFESDVISDGTQTYGYSPISDDGFESDVISDGTQTRTRSQ